LTVPFSFYYYYY